MKKIITLAVALIAAGAQTAAADPLMKYTYFDAAYEWTKDVEHGGGSANGLDTKVSYTPIDNFAIEGGYNYSELDTLGGISVNANQDLFRYGIAGWYSFCDDFDLVGRVGGVHSEISSDFGDASNDGVYAGLQVRTLLTDKVEGNADVTYTDVGGYNDWVYGLGALVALTDNLAFKAGGSISDESILTLTGGLRLAM